MRNKKLNDIELHKIKRLLSRKSFYFVPRAAVGKLPLPYSITQIRVNVKKYIIVINSIR